MNDTTNIATDKVAAGLAALWTFFWTLLGTAFLLLTGWLGQVAEWLSSEDEGVVFPSMAPLVKVAVAVFLAAVVGGLNWAYRWAQTHNAMRFLPGRRPSYSDDGGAVDGGFAQNDVVWLIVGILAIVALVLYITGR